MADTLEQDISKANRASLLVNDELFVEALEGLKAELTRRVFETRDPRERDRAVDLVNALDRIRGALVTYVSRGKLAKHELDQLLARRRQRLDVV